MNLAEEMRKRSEEVKMENFDPDVYINIIKQIKAVSNRGEDYIIIYFNNCDSNYLYPYVKHLERDGFHAISYHASDPKRMALFINW